MRSYSAASPRRVKCVVLTGVIVLLALPFGVTIASGVFGFIF